MNKLGSFLLTSVVATLLGVTAQVGAQEHPTEPIKIESPSPGRITGLVRQANGQPAAGLAVSLIMANKAAKEGSVKTDAGGNFELKWSEGQLPRNGAGPAIFVWDAQQNMTVLQELEEDSTNLELTLQPALTLTGLVNNSDSSPLAGAKIRATLIVDATLQSSAGLTATSDAQGRYEIKGLPLDSSFTVFASAKDHGEGRQELDEDTATNRVEASPFVLKPANRFLAGQVLDEDDQPAAGVNVTMSGEGQPSVNMSTDDKGRFRFQVCEGQIHLNASGSHGEFVQMKVEAGDTNVLLQLGPGGFNPGAKNHKLKGQVTGIDGKPAAGAWVAIFPNDGDTRWKKTTTNGTFNLTFAIQPWQRQSGGPWLVVSDSVREQGAVEEIDENATNVEVKLRRSLDVSGLVQGADGSPLPGADVSAQIEIANNVGALHEPSVVSDAHGRYEIKGLPADVAYLVSASATGHGQSQQEVSDDDDTHLVEAPPMALKQADRVLAGRVLDENDRSVANARVSLNGQGQPSGQAITDHQGRFQFQVCEGQISLFANPPRGGMSAQVRAEAGDTNVILQFGLNMINPGAKAHRVKGIVTDPAGQPVASAQLAVFPENGFNGPGPHWKKTAADGSYTVTWSLQPWQLQAGGPSLVIRAPAPGLGATAVLDEETTNLDVTLKPAVTAAGLVRNADDSPLPGAKVSAQLKTGNSTSINNSGLLSGKPVTSDAQGRYQVKGLPPDATFVFTAAAKGHSQSQQPLKLDSSTNRVELSPFVLRPADHVLVGQFLDDDGKPVADATVSCSGLEQPNETTTIDNQGHFRFAVCDGLVHLSASDQQGRMAQTSAEAGDTNVVLQFTQNNNFGPEAKLHKLAGRVTDVEGKPVAGARLAPLLSGQPNRPFWKRTADDGTFSLSWFVPAWQGQSGYPLTLVARDARLDLAAVEELPEGSTNFDLMLKQALDVTGLIRMADGSPLVGAQIKVQLRTGNNYNPFIEQSIGSDAQGHFKIHCLPPNVAYMVVASAQGSGKSQKDIPSNPGTNRVELTPFDLRPANRVLAGVVLNDKNKPATGAFVSMNGEGQPDASITTDTKGRFHFQVCEGEIRLHANSPQGGGFAQATAEGGDSNVVLTLGVGFQRGGLTPITHATRRLASPRTLTGDDLSNVHLPADAAPAGKVVLLCLFDAGQRSSRQVMRQLNEQAATLRQQGVAILGVQTLVTSGEIFNEWRSENPVSFQVGRATENSPKTKWVMDAPSLPWLMLTDTQHRVASEGFTLEELDEELKKLPK